METIKKEINDFISDLQHEAGTGTEGGFEEYTCKILNGAATICGRAYYGVNDTYNKQFDHGWAEIDPEVYDYDEAALVARFGENNTIIKQIENYLQTL